MRAQQFTIKGKLLGRNEREHLARTHWSKAASEKKRETELVMWTAKEAGLKKVESPVDVSIVFHEKVSFYKNGKRKKVRDVDNIQDGCKPILDGLVKAGIIPDDGPDWVKRVIPTVKYVRGEPRVTVILMDYAPKRRVSYPPVNVPSSDKEKDEGN